MTSTTPVCRHPHTMLGYILILVAATLWALIGVFTRGLLDSGVGAMEIALWRAVIAGAIFVIHAFLTDSFKLERKQDAFFLAGFGLVGVALFFGAYNMAIATGGISLAVILLYSAPAFVVILARVFLGEAITALKLVALVLVLGGVTLVSLGGGGTGVQVTGASVGWGLTAGLGYASYYIVGKRLLARYSPAAVYAFILPVGAVGLAPFVEFSPKSSNAWLLIVLLSVLSTYLAYLAYYSGLRLIEASRAVLVASLEPVIAASLAAVIFGERFGVWGFIGAGCVLLASLITVSARRRASRPDPDSAAAPDH